MRQLRLKRNLYGFSSVRTSGRWKRAPVLRLKQASQGEDTRVVENEQPDRRPGKRKQGATTPRLKPQCWHSNAISTTSRKKGIRVIMNVVTPCGENAEESHRSFGQGRTAQALTRRSIHTERLNGQ